jgi:hypothetical protein
MKVFCVAVRQCCHSSFCDSQIQTKPKKARNRGHSLFHNDQRPRSRLTWEGRESWRRSAGGPLIHVTIRHAVPDSAIPFRLLELLAVTESENARCAHFPATPSTAQFGSARHFALLSREFPVAAKAADDFGGKNARYSKKSAVGGIINSFCHSSRNDTPSWFKNIHVRSDLARQPFIPPKTGGWSH